jgi:hypothetical protein
VSVPNKGSKVFIEHTDSLKKFLKERKTGIFKKDFAEWCDGEGIGDRAGMQYWDRRIIAGEIEFFAIKSEKHWNSEKHWRLTSKNVEEIEVSEPSRTPSKKLKDYMEKEKLREKMKSGPCRHIECPFDADDCAHCGAYVNLHSKEFLEEEDS